MKPFRIHRGIVAPLDRDNVDTDAIIPKQFLKSIARTGFGENLFDAWRYLDHGEPGMDPHSRRPNPDFVLNQPRYQKASVLVAGQNFGCGSSREHAPWALEQFGFRAIVARSYADIFYNNCFKNGLLPIVLPDAVIVRILHDTAITSGYALTIDLERQLVVEPSEAATPFDVDASRKDRLLHGYDDIGLTLKRADAIRAFEAKHLAKRPWLDNTIA